MIDSHCHIDLPAFDEDRAQVLANAAKLGVERMLVPGLSLEHLEPLLALKSQHAMLDMAAGFHPYFLSHLENEQWQQQLKRMHQWLELHSSDIVAIGEFGMDGALSLPMDFQERVFVDQLEMASTFKKPVVLHHRKSHNALIRILKANKFTHGGVIHAFSGSAEIAKTYIDMGFLLGIGGTITYPRGAKTRRALESLSLDSFLLETDAPDMPLCGYQGQRNTPERLPLIAQHLSELKQVSVEEVSRITSTNYRRLFSSMLAP